MNAPANQNHAPTGPMKAAAIIFGCGLLVWAVGMLAGYLQMLERAAGVLK